MQTSIRTLDRLLDPKNTSVTLHTCNVPPLPLVNDCVWNWYKANPRRRTLLVEACHSAPRRVLEIVRESVGLAPGLGA